MTVSTQKKVKALVLLSGGLDSLLAIKVLQEQGIEVTGLSFTTPFFGADKARHAADQLGIPLMVEDITDVHLTMVKRPKHGYGKQMNPCIDCHTLMVKIAGHIMRRDGFDVIATGEVLGERPMSQNLDALKMVARESGCEGYLLRPLSAKLLQETLPEQEGNVDRAQLLAIEGRSRKPQMALAAHYGITSYVQPAGGCLLTDVHFSLRLKELLAHDPEAGPWDMRLLKLGRHFRFEDGTKVVVGRNESDNHAIEEAARPDDALFIPRAVPGPSSIVVGGGGEAVLARAAALTISFGDASQGVVVLELRYKNVVSSLTAEPSDKERWNMLRI
jgi:tRNA-uridine 2-sulfurtransferase